LAWEHIAASCVVARQSGKPRALTSAEISADRTGIRLSPLGNSGGLDEGPEAAGRASFFGGTEAGYTDYPALTA